MKTCRGPCGEEKPLADFSFDRKKGIYQARCRRCTTKIARRQVSDRSTSCSILPRWSALDDARLLTLVTIGVQLAPAAILIQRPVEGATQRLRRLRQTYAPFIRLRRPPPWPAERVAVLRELIEIKGYTRLRAAKRLGVTHKAAIGAVQKHLPQLCRPRQARVGI